MKKTFILIAVFAIALFAFWYYSRHPLQTTVMVRGTTFIVDVAVTPKEKEVGLGNRNALEVNHGMLFVYNEKARYPFWMRNMKFPIDILWIDDRAIVDITKNVPLSDKPLNELPIYHPAVPVDKVLEVNAGLVDEYTITVGDKIVIKN